MTRIEANTPQLALVDMNSARWKLDEVNAQRRSRVFWQLFTQDTWIVSCPFFLLPVLPFLFYTSMPPPLDPAFYIFQGGLGR